MKIFFDASLTGKSEYGENYKKIVEILEDLGHEVIKSTLFDRDVADVNIESSEEAEAWYKKLKQWVAKCELAVFDVSYPSTGIGHEVSLVLDAGKPVIALHVKSRVPHVLETIPSDRLQVVGYDDETLRKHLSEAVEYATEQMDTRFNFFVSPKISSYLDWVSRVKKIPRAVYLRRLIEEDMASQSDYQG